MTAPVTENEFFAALRGYASTLEVQLMIEEELKKFQEKTLPRLLADAVESSANTTVAVAQRSAAPSNDPTSESTPHEETVAASVHTPNGPAPSVGHASTPDAEWVQTFLRAHIDDTVARRLPTMIAQEVQRQLRAVNVAAAAAASSSLPKDGAAPVDLRTAVGLPPLPPPSPMRSSETAEAADTKTAVPLTSSSSVAGSDEGRRQRERILSAVDDVERQVNHLQRGVDAALAEREGQHRRWAAFCAVLEKRMAAVSGRSAEDLPPLPLRLQQWLDTRQDDALLSALEDLVRCLSQPRSDSEAAAAAVHRHVRSPSPTAELSSSSPLLTANRRAESNSEMQQQTQTQSLLQQQPPSPEASPTRTDGPVGRGSLYNSEPPSPPPVAPSSSARAQDYASLLNPETNHSTPTSIKTVGAAGSTTASPPLPIQQQPLQPQSPAGVGKGMRSITTKGSTAASTPSPTSGSTRNFLMTASDVLPNFKLTSANGGDGAVGGAAAAALNGLDGTAVRRPAPSPQDCVDPRMRDAARYTHAAARRTTSATCAASNREDGEPLREHHQHRSPTTTTTTIPATTTPTSATAEDAAVGQRPITLGIDAVNVPAGVLPDAFGRHGAVRVQSVTPRQLAERAGICRGDILLSVDRRSVRSCEQLRDVLRVVPAAQDTLTVELYRHTAHQIITVLLRL